MPERPAAFDTLALEKPLFPIAVRRILLVAASSLLACFCWLMLEESDSLNAQDLNVQETSGPVDSAEAPARRH